MTALRPGRQKARATELVCWSGGCARWTVQRAAVGEDSGLDSSSATVSCASETACVAIVEQATYANSDSSGRFTWFADVWNGESWSTGRAPEASSISCVPGLCAAIGDGRTAILDRGRWHIVRAPHSPEFQTGLSCASTSMCVGVGAPPPGPPQSGVLVTTPAGIRWNGSRWSRPRPCREPVRSQASCTGLPARRRTRAWRWARFTRTPARDRSRRSGAVAAGVWRTHRCRPAAGCWKVFRVSRPMSASRSVTPSRGCRTDSGKGRSLMSGTGHHGLHKPRHRWPVRSSS